MLNGIVSNRERISSLFYFLLDGITISDRWANLFESEKFFDMMLLGSLCVISSPRMFTSKSEI